ncbi:MAG: sigma-E processing peptidase SpoIIGA [Anaeroplasmataceae bacterium]|nr:sigma-E processing peptidase SpoIIGA [Anaeroplasmataceae bacterium]
MKYIELLVVTNVLIHFCFVKIAYYLLHIKPNYIAISISCLLDGAYICLYIFIPYIIENYRYLMIMVISIVPFITKRPSKALFLCLIYLMLNFTLGGSAGILFKMLNHYSVVIICLGIILVLFACYAIYKKFHFRPDVLEYEVLIEDANRKLYLSGFCDTGNFLTTDDNIPIVFLKRNIRIGKYYKTITIHSVSASQKIELFMVKSFKIKIKNKYIKKDVYLAYGDIAFNVMFGSNLLGG